MAGKPECGHVQPPQQAVGCRPAICQGMTAAAKVELGHGSGAAFWLSPPITSDATVTTPQNGKLPRTKASKPSPTTIAPRRNSRATLRWEMTLGLSSSRKRRIALGRGMNIGTVAR